MIIFKDKTMDYNKLISSKENEVLAHVVYKEHTLGYLFRCGNSLCLGILHASVLRGSPWNNSLGSISIYPHQFKHVREATEKDFDSFNVSSKGHLT